MKGWFKFVTLSFFSDKISSQAPERGYGTVFLTVAVAVLFLVLGFVGALLAPFRTLYRGATDFKGTLEDVFCGDGAVKLTVSDKKLSAEFGTAGKVRIDTVADEGDKKYASRGYDVIVDMRPAGLYDDFTAYCVTESGEKISYERYLELSGDEKNKYKFAVEYSGNELVIDDEKVGEYESYLAGSQDKAVAEAYKNLPDKTAATYKKELYELYVKAYYPDLSAYETSGAPKLRNYYYHNYLDRNKIIFIFDDAVIGNFVSGTGAQTAFYGFYEKLGDGDIAGTPRGIEDFLVNAYSASSQLMLFANMSGMVMAIPYTVIIVILLSAILYCLRMLIKCDELSFGGSVKTVAAYSPAAGLIAGLIEFAFGFVVSARYFTMVGCLAFFATVLVRIAVSTIVKKVRKAKADGKNTDDAASEQGDRV